MDEFEATSRDELARLRGESAKLYAELLLTEAVRALREVGGQAAVETFRDRANALFHERQDHEPGDDRPVRLAIEQIARSIQMVEHGHSLLPGWATEGITPISDERRN